MTETGVKVQMIKSRPRVETVKEKEAEDQARRKQGSTSEPLRDGENHGTGFILGWPHFCYTGSCLIRVS